jgi:transmembrane sensor
MGLEQDIERDSAVRESASVWLSKINRGLRDEEGPALRKWLKSREHREAITDAARLWWGPDVLAVLSELFPVEETGQRSRRRAPITALLAAATAVATVVSSALMLIGKAPWSKGARSDIILPRAQEIFTTASGETRRIALADGTVILLNSASRVVVVYWPTVRNAYLPFGEASFQVESDVRRRFIVRAGALFFETMGGTANLRVRSPENVDLTVTAGRVKVTYDGQSHSETPTSARLNAEAIPDDMTVAAGELAQFEADRQFVRKINRSEVDQLLGWQRATAGLP